MEWLLDLLTRIAPAKALLLCRSRAKVQALEEALRLRSGLPVARFHEDMNLLQRDRNAAFFADPEGNRWEITWGPRATFDERGALLTWG